MDELDALSAAWRGPVCSAACHSRSAGVGIVGMSARFVRGLLDRHRRSVVDDARWAWGSLGPPWPLSVSSSKTTSRAAGGGVRLRRQERLGFFVS